MRGRPRSRFRLSGPFTDLEAQSQLARAYVRVRNDDRAWLHARLAARAGIAELRARGLWPDDHNQGDR